MKNRKETETVKKIFYIMGRSASGKDKIYRQLMKEGTEFEPLVIYTTRPKRAGETEGKQYHFIDDQELDRLKSEGKVIESRDYNTVMGIWTYCTVDDGAFSTDGSDMLAIGTLESYIKMKERFGEENVIPLYIESSDENLLLRSIKREKKQERPNYEEVCRRFLADSADFSEDKLKAAGITKRFRNDGLLEECVTEIRGYIDSMRSRA